MVYYGIRIKMPISQKSPSKQRTYFSSGGTILKGILGSQNSLLFQVQESQVSFYQCLIIIRQVSCQVERMSQFDCSEFVPLNKSIFDTNNHVVTLQSKVQIREGQTSISRGQNQGPLVQNYFCQVSEDRIIKVTKIYIENEVLILTDHILLEKTSTQNKTTISNSGIKMEPSSTETSSKEVNLPPLCRKMLKLFYKWVDEQRPDLREELQLMDLNSSSEKDLRERIRASNHLRESFIQFSKEGTGTKREQGVKQMIVRWKRMLKNTQDQYNNSEQFLNDLLTVQQKRT